MNAWRPLTANLCLHTALAIPCIYHGIWNLSNSGTAWWRDESSLPPWLRYFVGVGEIAAAVGLWSGWLRRPAAAALSLVFLGAIPQHITAGYSFKHGGYETPLAYLLLSLFIALRPRSIRTSLDAN